MDNILINFELPTGKIVITEKLTRNGVKYYDMVNEIEGYYYFTQNWDKIWNKFMLFIDSINYMK